VPNGPGITTAQPFLPERELGRLFRTADMNPVALTYTLNPEPRAAGIPDPAASLSFALPADGSSPTVDTARAVSGDAMCARLVESARGGRLGPAPASLSLGTSGSVRRTKLRLVFVDLLGNPTDPAGLTPKVTIDGPFTMSPDRDGNDRQETLAVRSAKGAAVTIRATGPGQGAVRISLGGAVCQRIALESRVERDRGGSDAVVDLAGHGDFTSIDAAAANATDRNGDGRITIEVGEGIYRETVRLVRPVEVHGAGAGRTIVDARGLGPALVLANSGARASGITASGGTMGVAVQAPVTASGLDAWANIGAGVRVVVAGAEVADCTARRNGGDGFEITAPATLTRNASFDNSVSGIAATSPAPVTMVENQVLANGSSGIEVAGSGSPVLLGNTSVGNLGTGIDLSRTAGGELTGNVASANDGDGVRLNQLNGVLVDANECTGNGGYGIVGSLTTGTDFDDSPGTQPPPGSNDIRENHEGEFTIE
jgi:parallel beta-helix repeat protein